MNDATAQCRSPMHTTNLSAGEMSADPAAALGTCATAASASTDAAAIAAAAIAQLRGHPGFAQLSPEQQDLLVAGTDGWFRQQHCGTAGLQQPALGGQIASRLLNDQGASGSAGAGARQAAPPVAPSGGGRDGQAQSLLPASPAAAAQAAANALTERLRACPGSTLQAAASTPAPARVPALDSTGATLQGRRPRGQPALDMSVLERLQDRISGKFYVVVHGSRGAGFFGDWGTCGVTGCSGAVFKKFEFNQKGSGGNKHTSFAACEKDAIDYLLAHERTPSQVIADLRAVVDARAAAAAAAAREEEAHEEAERARRAREQAEATEAAAAERWARHEAAAAEERRQEEQRQAAEVAAAEAAAAEARAVAAAVEHRSAEIQAALQEGRRESQRRAAARRGAERHAAGRRQAATHEAAARTAALRFTASRHVAAAAIEAVLARYRPQGKSHVRSVAAKQRRRKAKTAGAAKVEAARPANTGVAQAAAAELGSCTVDEALTHERALRRKAEARAADAGKLVRQGRKRLRREVRTADQRARQDERRSGKAKQRARKVKALRGVGGAARKEKERVRKRKQPMGEPLHTSECKHRRLVEHGGGSSGGKGGGKGSSRGSSGGKGCGKGYGKGGGKGGGKGDNPRRGA
jgi:hypothetical protein